MTTRLHKSFEERDVNGVTVLTVERVLKGTLESLLKERIDELVREGRLQIVVDLKQVPYVDSSDIGRLIRAHLSVRQAGGRVRLCNLAERVSAVLRLTRLDTVLDLYQTEEEALASIQQTKRDERTTAPGEPA
jgi:anti-sigma B factor antagonist